MNYRIDYFGDSIYCENDGSPHWIAMPYCDGTGLYTYQLALICVFGILFVLITPCVIRCIYDDHQEKKIKIQAQTVIKQAVKQEITPVQRVVQQVRQFAYAGKQQEQETSSCDIDSV